MRKRRKNLLSELAADAVRAAPVAPVAAVAVEEAAPEFVPEPAAEPVLSGATAPAGQGATLADFWEPAVEPAPVPVPKRFLVSVPHGGRAVVEAYDPDGAVEAFKELCGVQGSEHAFDVTELEPGGAP